MKVGLIGSGFMGKAHAFGFATAERVFDLPVSFEMDILADATLDLAEAARAAFGFQRATENWRDLIMLLRNMKKPGSKHQHRLVG